MREKFATYYLTDTFCKNLKSRIVIYIKTYYNKNIIKL